MMLIITGVSAAAAPTNTSTNATVIHNRSGSEDDDVRTKTERRIKSSNGERKNGINNMRKKSEDEFALFRFTATI